MRRLLLATVVLAAFACGTNDGSDGTGSESGDAVSGADAVTPTDAGATDDVHVPDPAKDCGTCPADQAHCDPVTGVCQACVLPSHCGVLGQRCIDHVCVGTIPCTDDAGCSAVGGVCKAGSCVACIKDEQCSAGKMCRSDHCVPAPAVCEEDGHCGEWTCAKSWGQCVQCQAHADCGTAQHCLGGYCVPDVCAAGEATCKPGTATIRQVCSDEGDQFAEVSCGTEEHVCADGKCIIGTCSPGVSACLGLQRAVCSANGQHLVPVQDCGATGSTCVQGKCVKSVCDPGTTTCVDGDAAICNEHGSAWSKSPCFGSTICVDGTCQATLCTVGQLTCSGSKLLDCLGGIKTVTVNDCADTKQVCEGGQCVTPICSAGAQQCNGNAIETCSAKGTEWKTTKTCSSSTPYCIDGSCVNQVCKPGQTTCGGDSILTCGAGQLKWDAKKCPVGQVCIDGPKCSKPICTPPGTLPEPIQKGSAMKTATTFNSCDLNGDGKPDNAIASVGGLFGDLDGEIAKSINSGDLIILLQATGWNTTGKTFAVGLHTGKLDAASKSCSLTSSIANCGYKVSAKGVNVSGGNKGACPAKNALDKAKITGKNLVATGSAGKVTLPLSMLGVGIPLAMHKLRIQGVVTDSKTWKTTANGKLCGAVKKTDLDAAIDSIPDAVFQQIGFSKSMVKMLLGTILKMDIDTDGDATLDAYSAAFTMSTVPGKITGLGL